MQAIKTKYCNPTNTRGSRIQASCEARTIYLSYDYALDSDGNHRAACEALRRAMGLTINEGVYSEMVGGWYNGAMYWVFIDVSDRTNVNGITNAQVAA